MVVEVTKKLKIHNAMKFLKKGEQHEDINIRKKEKQQRKCQKESQRGKEALYYERDTEVNREWRDTKIQVQMIEK